MFDNHLISILIQCININCREICWFINSLKFNPHPNTPWNLWPNKINTTKCTKSKVYTIDILTTVNKWHIEYYKHKCTYGIHLSTIFVYLYTIAYHFSIRLDLKYL